jgi:hypothetical protein
MTRTLIRAVGVLTLVAAVAFLPRLVARLRQRPMLRIEEL